MANSKLPKPPSTEKPHDKLERSLVWFALGLLVAGAISAVAFQKFVADRVKAEIQSPDVLALIAKNAAEVKAVSLPKGTILLYGGRCPTEWEDLTSTFSGRYIFVDESAIESLRTYEDDGSHNHDGGTHSHDVTGRTGRLGGGERRGGENRDAAHMNNTTTITGTAHPENSGHTHSGGKHQHRRIGLRLCKI